MNVNIQGLLMMFQITISIHGKVNGHLDVNPIAFIVINLLVSYTHNRHWTHVLNLHLALVQGDEVPFELEAWSSLAFSNEKVIASKDRTLQEEINNAARNCCWPYQMFNKKDIQDFLDKKKTRSIHLLNYWWYTQIYF